MAVLINPFRFGPGQPTWNSADKDSDIALSDGDRTATATNGGGVRSVSSISTGLRYVEAPWVTINSGANGRFGIANASFTITGAPGGDTNSWCIQGDGDKITNNTAASYGTAFSNGDVCMLALNLTSGKVWFGNNGTWFNSGDPVAGTNEAYSSLAGPLYLVFGRASGSDRAITLQTVGSYAYTPPTGFTKGW